MKTGKIFIENGIINIEVVRDGMVFDVYTIPLSDCRTAGGVCRWIRQIGEKVWTDKESLLRFVQCVLKELGE